MGFLTCQCGFIIRGNETDTEGFFVGCLDRENSIRDFEKSADELLQAIASGKRDDWVAARFGDRYAEVTTNAEVFADLYDQSSPMRSISECRKCGRLWLKSKKGDNIYHSFVPDEGNLHEILA